MNPAAEKLYSHGFKTIFSVPLVKPDKNKNKYLCLCSDIQNPNQHSIQILKRTLTKNKTEWLRDKIDINTLSAVNCCEKNTNKISFTMASCDIVFLSTAKKSVKVTTKEVKDKTYFVCNLFAFLRRTLGEEESKQIKFNNLPLEWDETRLLAGEQGDVVDWSYLSGEFGETLDDRTYCTTLTAQEEHDLELFLAGGGDEFVDVSAFINDLTKELQVREQDNIYSMVRSQAKVDMLMESLTVAEEAISGLQERLGAYNHFLEEVQDSVGKMTDHDDLLRLTTGNRDSLLGLLGHLNGNFALGDDEVVVLNEAKLDSPENITQCDKAANLLRGLLETNFDQGVEHLTSYKQSREMLEHCRNEFAKKFFVHLTVVLKRQQEAIEKTFGAYLERNYRGELGQLSDIHEARWQELGCLTGFMQWYCSVLEANFSDLVEVYVNSAKTLYACQMELLLLQVRALFCPITQEGDPKPLLENASEESSCALFSDALSNTFRSLKEIVEREEMFITGFLCFEGKSLKMKTACLSHIFESLSDNVIGLMNRAYDFLPCLAMPMLLCVDRHNKSSCEFVSDLLAKCQLVAHSYLSKYLHSFVAAAESAVTIRENKDSRHSGVLPFVEAFCEMLALGSGLFRGAGAGPRLEEFEDRVRGNLGAIMSSLDTVALSAGSKTPPCVVIFVNCHRLMDGVRSAKLTALDAPLADLKSRYKGSLDEYVETCVSGLPFERLHRFFDGLSAKMSEEGARAEQMEIYFRRTTLKRLIEEYPGPVVKRNLESLFRKVRKQLGRHGDLLEVVWLAISMRLVSLLHEYEALITRCYPNCNLRLLFDQEDLRFYFNAIASSHSGSH